MTDGGPAAEGDAHEAGTLPRLFVRAMRKHDRSAVLLDRDGERRRETPDWRFERQGIRLALFPRDRAAVAPGGRGAILSPLPPGLAVARIAAIAPGAPPGASAPARSAAR